MDHQPGLFSATENLDISPPQVVVSEHRFFCSLEPRTGQVDQIQREFGFCPVGQTHGLNLGLGRPSQTGGVRQAEHAMADPGKADRQTDDDETHSVSLLFGQPGE